MKPLLLTILICLISLAVAADTVDTDATGYQWTRYSRQEKYALTASMLEFYDLDKDMQSVEKGIELLEAHYSAVRKRARKNRVLDRDIHLSIPCLLSFGAIVDQKESDLALRELARKDTGLKMGLRTVSELEHICVGMPKEDLEQAGYTEHLQQDYRKEDNEEWITYLDWTTEEPNDTVSFYIVDGKVKSWKQE